MRTSVRPTRNNPVPSSALSWSQRISSVRAAETFAPTAASESICQRVSASAPLQVSTTLAHEGVSHASSSALAGVSVPAPPAPVATLQGLPAQALLDARSYDAGLDNVGNTCFFNALCVCLSSAVPFADRLLRHFRHHSAASTWPR